MSVYKPFKLQAHTQEIDWAGAFQYIMYLNSAVFVDAPGFFLENTH